MSPDVPDVTEYVVGYRQWVMNDDGRLGSIGAPSVTWTPGVNTAVCLAADYDGNHAAPGHGCDCGLYAYHSYVSDRLGDRGVISTRRHIDGVCRAHGRVESHHQGFRAQYAEVVALAQRDDRHPTLREQQAADYYAVPLVTAAELEAVGLRYGRPLGASLRPPAPRVWEDDGAAAAPMNLRGSPRGWGTLLHGVQRSPAFGRAQVALVWVHARAAALLRRYSHTWKGLRDAANAPGVGLLTFLLWGLAAALIARGELPTRWILWMPLVPLALAYAARHIWAQVAPRTVATAASWTDRAPPVILAAGVPLQLATTTGVGGLPAATLEWAVGLLAAGTVWSAVVTCWRNTPALFAAIAWGMAVTVIALLIPGSALLTLSLAGFATWPWTVCSSPASSSPR